MAEGHAKAEHQGRATDGGQRQPGKHAMSDPSSPESYTKDDVGGGGGGGGGGFTIAAVVCFLLLLLGVTALVLWLVYRPHKPRFTAVGAVIYDLNLTAAPLISTSVQFTVLARNPNRRLSIHYDKLSMYVAYRDQIITPPLSLPPLHLGKKSTVVVAPVMGGVGIPVSPEVANGLRMDQSYGIVSMKVVIVGKLRWKTGPVRTGRYGFYVKCDTWLSFKRGSSGQALLAPSKCKVDL